MKWPSEPAPPARPFHHISRLWCFALAGAMDMAFELGPSLPLLARAGQLGQGWRVLPAYLAHALCQHGALTGPCALLSGLLHPPGGPPAWRCCHTRGSRRPAPSSASEHTAQQSAEISRPGSQAAPRPAALPPLESALQRPPRCTQPGSVPAAPARAFALVPCSYQATSGSLCTVDHRLAPSIIFRTGTSWAARRTALRWRAAS